MPIRPDASIEVSALNWVPDFAKGLVRDFRVRWALEEAGLPYRVKLYDPREPKPEAYLEEQPFAQVPAFRDGAVRMFESGAIVLHIAERSEQLMPADPAGRARTQCWVLAALNSIEPSIGELIACDIFADGADWAKERRPQVVERVRQRLQQLSGWLGGKDYLEGRFTAGDLMMTTVLRELRHTELVAEQPTLAAYQARCEARPAFKAALEAQLEGFRALESA